MERKMVGCRGVQEKSYGRRQHAVVPNEKYKITIYITNNGVLASDCPYKREDGTCGVEILDPNAEVTLCNPFVGQIPLFTKFGSVNIKG